MRVQFLAVPLLALCLVTGAASAQTSLGVSPTTIRPGGEDFLSIFVTGLTYGEAITITFNGPAGQFTLEPVYVDSAKIITFIPLEVMVVEGRYSVDVYVQRGELIEHFGPGFFDVEIPQDEPEPFYLVLPEVVTVEATSLAGAKVDFEAVTNTGATATCTPASGSNFPLGGTLVDCTATNALGQSAEGAFAVFVFDSTPPVLTLPQSFTSTNPVTYTVTASDTLDPDPSVVCYPASGSTLPAGPNKINCFAYDHQLNYAFGSFTVTVPGGPPVLTLPADIQAEATSAAGAEVTFDVSADDGVVTCSHASGATFPLGGTVVSCSATNENGTTTGAFNIVVGDFTAPVLTVPADFTVNASSLSGAVVTFVTSATDVVDSNPTIVCAPASGATFPIGETLVICHAFDDYGNTDFNEFTVTVLPPPPPELTVPSDMTVEATGPDGATVTFTATATNDGVVTCTPASGSLFAVGTTTVSCTATNVGGSDTETFKVNVVDTTAPIIILVKPSHVALWPPDHKMVPISVTVVAIDAVDLDPTTVITSVSSNQPVNGTGDGDTAPDWEITGPLTLDLRAERAGTQDRIYTITVETTDASGNTSTAATTVRVTQSRRR